MGHIELSDVSFALPDGRPLLEAISLRVGEGAVMALVGPNGTGKTTLSRIISGELDPAAGTVTHSGGVAVMRQFVGSIRDDSTVRDLLLSLSTARIQQIAADIDDLELRLMSEEDEATQLRYAQRLADYADAGGYDAEVLYDVCCTAALGVPYERARWREVRTLSGGEQKRLALELLLRGTEQVLVLDEPDNYLDVPGKQWLESQLDQTTKSIVLISHDRELLANTATAVAALELGGDGNTLWVHPGSFSSFAEARRERFARLAEDRRRWDEEHAKLKSLVTMYRQKAAYNSDMASRLQAAVTRLERFVAIGPPQALAREQQVTMRLEGGRTAKRAVICEDLELTGLMRPFSTEVWFADRVAVLGSNGSGKSHFLRLLAAGGTRPEPEQQPSTQVPIAPTAHTGLARLGSRVRPGWFAQTHDHPELHGRTLLEILHRGDEHREGLGTEAAARKLDRYELARSAEQRFETLSGGQQARMQILLLELSGVTLLLLDEPTDNLDLESAEALEHGLAQFEGAVIAVTHDRWFARQFDRFLIFGADGEVTATDQPVWDEGRVRRSR